MVTGLGSASRYRAIRVTTSSQRLRFSMGTGLALMGAFGFATSGPFSESVLAAGVSPMQLSEMRQIVNAAVLLVLVLILRPCALRLRLAQLPMLMFYGVTSYLLNQTLYLFAITRIPIGIALLIEFTAPTWVALWVRFVRGTRLPRLTWLGMGLTLVGLVFVCELWNGLRLDAIGVLAALGSALCLTVFYLMAEQKLAEFDPLGLVAWGSISAGVLFAVVWPVWKLPFHLLEGNGGLPQMHWPLWQLVLLIGILSTALPAVWQVSAMRFIGSATASVIGTTEVLGGAVLAWVLIGQTLTTLQVIGGIVVLVGIAVDELRPQPREPGAVVDPNRCLVAAGLGIPNTPGRKKVSAARETAGQQLTGSLERRSARADASPVTWEDPAMLLSDEHSRSMIEVGLLETGDRVTWERLARDYKAFYRDPMPYEAYEAIWQRLRDGTELHGLGARIDGQLIGIAHYFFHPTFWSGEACYLDDLFVDEAVRGRGAARALIERVAQAARDRGATRYYWHTQEDNARARVLYDRVARFTGSIRYRYPLLRSVPFGHGPDPAMNSSTPSR